MRPRHPARRPLAPALRRGLVAAAVLVAGVAATPPTALAADGDRETPAPRHQLDLLALLVIPTAEPVSDIYGDHTGVALRYGLRFRPRWSLAAEAGQRSASGSTPELGSDAELDVTHGALMVRFHRQASATAARAWDAWLGAGMLYESVEETVRFPDAAVSADETASGPLVAVGTRWTGSRGWGFIGELRYAVLGTSPGMGLPDADLDGLEIAAGVGYSF